MRILRALLPLVFSGCAAAAGAQNVINEEIVCISHGPYWRGNGAEVRAIETVPVPASYRRLEPSGSCARSSIMFHNLIGWHIGFGSERSTAAAFDHLEGYYLSGLPGAADYRQAVEQARRSALPVLRSTPGRRHSRLLLRRESPEVRQLDRLIDGAAYHLYLAEFALLAAEEFESLPLLERADRHFRAISETASWLADPAVARPLAGLFDDEFETFRVAELRMRIAVWRAHLTRAPADIARAETLVTAAEGPGYRRLAESFMGGRDACAIDPEAEWEAANDACNAQQNLQGRVASWIANRAKLDLVIGSEDRRDYNLAQQLLLRGWGLSSAGCCRPAAADDLLRLRLLDADTHRRQLDAATEDADIREHLSAAMFELGQALEVLSPVRTPARFSRIAETWLQLWARAHSRPEWSAGPASSVEEQRYAVYLRALLDALPGIATAGD
ncbi:MAG: hypothetical protein QOI38_2068 [Sphingomonadales bacterium]|jgi:uncharacterized small protein (DUF1192 family)|nr:hypothetical protein [Sphingomonadales bacterium]